MVSSPEEWHDTWVLIERIMHGRDEEIVLQLVETDQGNTGGYGSTRPLDPSLYVA